MLADFIVFVVAVEARARHISTYQKRQRLESCSFLKQVKLDTVLVFEFISCK